MKDHTRAQALRRSLPSSGHPAQDAQADLQDEAGAGMAPGGGRRLDDAARAAWLAYVGGLKQDEIAAQMGISRQAAQRLVSQALAADLVKVRIDHPIARCMELAQALVDRFGLATCEVVPTLASAETSGLAVSWATGDLIESWLMRDEGLTIGLGTGRTLRAAVEHLPQIDCPQHRIVSLTGNITRDGSTATYNVLFTMADKVTAPTFPMPLPVVAATPEEREALLGQKTLTATRALAERTDVRFLGIGTMGAGAPLVLDGFLTEAERARLADLGAVGEITGHVFDAAGRPVDDPVNARICSASLPSNPRIPTIASARGLAKVPAIRGALVGRLFTGLVTDEDTAAALLA
jgi:DNA-binding transcriptional regulator LsrR (DeoR family)